jgi:WD40 repeat protein
MEATMLNKGLPPAPPCGATPPEPDRQRMELLLAEQTRRWRAGAPQPVEVLVAGLTGVSEAGLLDLIYNEILLREQENAKPIVEEYQKRFPQLASQLRVQFELDRLLHSGGASTTTEGQANSTLEAKRAARYLHSWPKLPGYQIVEVLGRGGMGIAYKAWQERLRRLVALKLLRSDDDVELQRRFLAEARAAARLQHQNIVQIFEVNEHEGRSYLALEYVEGGTLAERLAGTPQAAIESAALVETLARAIHYAHEHGIIHRDLKPANVLLSGPEGQRFGSPKIADFGLAKQLDADVAQTQSGAILGTPSYMAPEQAGPASAQVGPAADVYALGAILYEMLTGRPPFKAGNVLETLEQARTREPVAPRQLQPKIPLDLETICLKCLEKEPGRRYASALALAEELARFSRGEPILARPVGSLSRGWRWCRRNPLLAGVSGLAAMALLIGAGVATALAISRSAALDRLERTAADQRQTLLQAQRQLTATELQRGIGLCQEGQVGQGMLWIARSVQTASSIEGGLARDLTEPARLNLAAWRPQMVSLRAVVSHHGEWSPAVALSGDGRALLIGGQTSAPPLYEVPSGRCTQTLDWSGYISAAAFTLDGRLLALSSRGKSQLWDMSPGKQPSVLMTFTPAAGTFALAPDGRTLLTVGELDHTVRSWNLPSRTQVGKSSEYPGTARKIVVNRQGNAFLTVWIDGSIRLGRLLPEGGFEITHTLDTRASDACFHPDGESVATVSADGRANLWLATTGQFVRTLLEHGAALFCVALSPDGKTIVTGGKDNIAQQWDVATGQRLGMPLHHQNTVDSVVYTPEGRILITHSTPEATRFWDVAPSPDQSSDPWTGPVSINALAVSAQGRILATGGTDNLLRRWDVSSRRALGEPLSHPGAVNRLLFSPDDRLLLAGSRDGSARLWDTATWSLRGAPLATGSSFLMPEFSPDSSRLFLAKGAGCIQVVDTATGKHLHDFGEDPDVVNPRPRVLPDGRRPAPRLVVAAWSPDGRRALSGFFDAPASRWDLDSGKCQELPLHAANEGGVTAAVFTADGRHIVTGSFRGFVRRWDASSGEPLGPAMRHQGSIEVVAVSPDGQTLLTTSRDQTARLWDLASGTPLSPPLRHKGNVRLAAFSSDGRMVATASDDQTLRFWDAVRGIAVGPAWTNPSTFSALTFLPTQQSFIIGTRKGLFSRPVPSPLEGDPTRLTRWLEWTTGLELAAGDELHVLDADAWNERRQQVALIGETL